MSKMGSETGPRLTEQQLELSVNGDYDFDLGGEQHGEGEKPEEAKAAEETKAAEAAPKEKGDGEGEDSQEEEDADDGDGEQFNLFFDRDEIESTTGHQQFDAFEELRDFRRECLITGQIGNKLLNKISIEEFAPKEDELKSNLGKLKGKGKRGEKSKQESNAGDLFEEQNVAEAEAEEALQEVRARQSQQELLVQHKEEQKQLKNEIEELLS
jgi:hypothetical protein